MAYGMPTLVVGNVTADPELKFGQNGGKPYVSLRIANTPRVKNRESGQYEDGEPTFVGVTLYDGVAENAAASITKGTRVIAYGDLEKKVWTDRENNLRESMQLENVTVFGVDLRFARAQVHRGGAQGGQQAAPQGAQQSYGGPQGQPSGYGPARGQQAPPQQVAPPQQQGGYPAPPQQQPQQPMQQPQQQDWTQQPQQPQQAPQQDWTQQPQGGQDAWNQPPF